MMSKDKQDQFISITSNKLSVAENDWVTDKILILKDNDNVTKFGVFFSLASRFMSQTATNWNTKELESLEIIYPGFGNTQWTSLDIARVRLMMALHPEKNIKILSNVFEIAEMKEQASLYKGLYLLTNAEDFRHQVTEGIRTNMVNVFDAIAQGNPYAITYLSEDAWNQLILKSLFMGRKLYTIQGIDEGKNKNLATMLQDFVKERWAAGRNVSLEIWRMIDGFLRDDVKALMMSKYFEGIEKEIIEKILDENATISKTYWNTIGTLN